MRGRIIVAMALPSRSCRYLLPLLGSGSLALVIVAMAFTQSAQMGSSEYLTLLRVAAATLATGAAFLLNDAAIRTTAVMPVSRATRYVARLIQGGVVILCWWAVVLPIVWLRASEQAWHDLPTLGLLLESNTMAVVAVTAAAWLRSILDGQPGLVVSLLLLGIIICASLLPSQAHVLVQPGDPRWEAAQRFWGLLLVASLVAFGLAAREGTKRPLRLPGR